MTPDKYTYNLPEGYIINPETRSKLDTHVAKTNLSNEDAQTFINLHVELMEEFAKAVGYKAAEYNPEQKEE